MQPYVFAVALELFTSASQFNFSFSWPTGDDCPLDGRDADLDA